MRAFKKEKARLQDELASMKADAEARRAQIASLSAEVSGCWAA